MWAKISEAVSRWCKEGVYLPYAHDAERGKPSASLLFMYVSFVIAACSVIALHLKAGLLIATLTSIMFWVLAMTFYRIRKLDKFKIDLDDKTIELDADEDEEPTDASSGTSSEKS
jgi:hypothetical protein